MNKIKFAIVGLGHIGKRHAQVINNNPHAQLSALADIDTSRHSELENNFGLPVYKSLEELLHKERGLDVINICTPNGLHASLAIAALTSGQHVVCEKPMALSTADGLAMIRKSREVNKHIFCVMQNRYSPSATWLKEVIDQNILGNINLVIVNCFWNRDHRYYNSSAWRGTRLLDGGTLFTQFSHFIDTIYWLFGDIKNIHCRLHNFNHGNLIEFEDTGIVSFDFVRGGSCNFNYSTSVWDKNSESSITIIGEKGTIKVGGQYMNQVEYCHVQNYQMPELAPSLPPNDYGHYKGSAANHDFVIQNVVDFLQGKSEIKTDAVEGLKVVEIIENIYIQGIPDYRTISSFKNSATTV